LNKDISDHRPNTSVNNRLVLIKENKLKQLPNLIKTNEHLSIERGNDYDQVLKIIGIIIIYLFLYIHIIIILIILLLLINYSYIIINSNYNRKKQEIFV
jgi:hypothetical protein